MKQLYFAAAILSALLALPAMAQNPETTPPQTSPADKSVVTGTNAGGEKQTTVIDESGNLKIINKSTPPTTPQEPQSVQSMPNNTQQSTTPGMMPTNPSGFLPKPPPINPNALPPQQGQPPLPGALPAGVSPSGVPLQQNTNPGQPLSGAPPASVNPNAMPLQQNINPAQPSGTLPAAVPSQPIVNPNQVPPPQQVQIPANSSGSVKFGGTEQPVIVPNQANTLPGTTQ